MPNMSDIVVKVKERLRVVGGIVVAKGRFLYLKGLGE
jgi:hypothetical protein